MAAFLDSSVACTFRGGKNYLVCYLFSGLKTNRIIFIMLLYITVSTSRIFRGVKNQSEICFTVENESNVRSSRFYLSCLFVPGRRHGNCYCM